MDTFAPVPILRIFDEQKAKEFYVDFLGFTVEWEHRFEPGMPLYCGIRKVECVIHLSEHHGDACPGSSMRVKVEDVKAFKKELIDKQYQNARPGYCLQPWGTVDMDIKDPFGNRITFFTEY